MASTAPRTLTSQATTISVTDTPYDLPSAGQALAIGFNYAVDVKPASHTNDLWNYACFSAYGGGTYVKDYSIYGAFVIAGTGGHFAPPNTGGLVFDFADATWKRIDNANGVPWQSTDYSDPPDINAEGELLAATGNMPAPAHTYASVAPLSAANGGGTKGSVILTVRSGVTTAGGSGHVYGRSHRFDLSSGQWSRFTTTSLCSYPYLELPCAYDSTLNRIWQLPSGIHTRNQLEYIDVGTATWGRTATFPYLTDSAYAGNAIVWDAQRLILAVANNGKLYAFRPDNAALGWTALSVSGTLPHYLLSWAYYPVNGRFYTCDNAGAVYELIPPVSNPLTNQWTVQIKSFSGPSLPAATRNSATNPHFTRFFYVSSISCLAWIAGGTDRVMLMKP